MGYVQGEAVRFCNEDECLNTYPLREWLDTRETHCENHRGGDA